MTKKLFFIFIIAIVTINSPFAFAVPPTSGEEAEVTEFEAFLEEVKGHYKEFREYYLKENFNIGYSDIMMMHTRAYSGASTNLKRERRIWELQIEENVKKLENLKNLPFLTFYTSQEGSTESSVWNLDIFEITHARIEDFLSRGAGHFLYSGQSENLSAVLKDFFIKRRSLGNTYPVKMHNLPKGILQTADHFKAMNEVFVFNFFYNPEEDRFKCILIHSPYLLNRTTVLAKGLEDYARYHGRVSYPSYAWHSHYASSPHYASYPYRASYYSKKNALYSFSGESPEEPLGSTRVPAELLGDPAKLGDQFLLPRYSTEPNEELLTWKVFKSKTFEGAFSKAVRYLQRSYPLRHLANRSAILKGKYSPEAAIKAAVEKYSGVLILGDSTKKGWGKEALETLLASACAGSLLADEAGFKSEYCTNVNTVLEDISYSLEQREISKKLEELGREALSEKDQQKIDELRNRMKVLQVEKEKFQIKKHQERMQKQFQSTSSSVSPSSESGGVEVVPASGGPTRRVLHDKDGREEKERERKEQ